MHGAEDSGNWGPENADHLAQRVRLFFDHGRLRGLRTINIEVIGDTVVLTGHVATFHQKQLCTAFARKVAGVGEVTNRLEVHDGVKNDKHQRQSGLAREAHVDDEANRRLSYDSSNQN
jgi:hypothetical protein